MSRHTFRLPALALVAVAALIFSGCSDDGDGGDGGNAEETTTTAAGSTGDNGDATGDDAGGEDAGTDDPGSGDSDPGSEAGGEPAELPATLEAAAATRAEQSRLDPESTKCLADGLAKELGEERAVALLNSTESPNDEEVKVFAEAGNACYTSEQLAASLAEAISSDIGLDEATTAKVQSCFAKEWEGRAGDVLAATARSGEEALANETFANSLDTCMDTKVIARVVTGSMQPTDEQVDCVSGRLDGKVRFSQVFIGDEEAGKAINEAMQACGLLDE